MLISLRNVIDKQILLTPELIALTADREDPDRPNRRDPGTIGYGRNYKTKNSLERYFMCPWYYPAATENIRGMLDRIGWNVCSNGTPYLQVCGRQDMAWDLNQVAQGISAIVYGGYVTDQEYRDIGLIDKNGVHRKLTEVLEELV